MFAISMTTLIEMADFGTLKTAIKKKQMLLIRFV